MIVYFWREAEICCCISFALFGSKAPELKFTVEVLLIILLSHCKFWVLLALCYCSHYYFCYCFSLCPGKLKCIKLKRCLTKTHICPVKCDRWKIYQKKKKRQHNRHEGKTEMCSCLEKKKINKKISSISLNRNKRNSEKTFAANGHHIEFCCWHVSFTINFIHSIALIDSGGVHFLQSTTFRCSLDGHFWNIF